VLKIAAMLLGVTIVVLAIAWLELRGPDIPYETLEAKYTDSASHFVDLPGGLHVHYRDEGDPNRPLLVLLHGFGDSFTSWDGWVPELKGRFRLIRLDFPGHGLTRAPEGFVLRDNAGLADFVGCLCGHPCVAEVRGSRQFHGGAAWHGNSRCATRSESMR